MTLLSAFQLSEKLPQQLNLVSYLPGHLKYVQGPHVVEEKPTSSSVTEVTILLYWV